MSMNSVDFAYENMVAQDWEDQNRPAYDEEALRKAEKSLDLALEELDGKK